MRQWSSDIGMDEQRSNKPDAANPAMALWLTIEDQWRRVAELDRSTKARQ
jgi:hypothetical protein